MKTNRAKPGLLDSNVLVALIDPAHQFHGPAHTWFRAHRSKGWATCPLTENGCLRVMSNPGYPFPGLTVARLREILTELVRVEGHRFWPDSISFLEPNPQARQSFDLAHVGPKHLTDIYLLSLAISNRGCLITFDRNIPVQAIAGFRPDDIEVLNGTA